MGASVSKTKSVSDIVMENTVKIMSSAAAVSAASANASNTMNIEAGCDISNSNIDQTSQVTLNTLSIQSISQSAEVTNKIKESTKQKVENSTKNFGMSANMTDQIVNKSLKLATAIQQNVDLKCLAAATSVNVINCKGGKVTSSNIAQKAVADMINKCVQTSSQVTEAKADLDSLTDQGTSNTTGMDSSVAIMMFIIIGIVVVVGGYLFMKSRGGFGNRTVPATVSFGLKQLYKDLKLH